MNLGVRGAARESGKGVQELGSGTRLTPPASPGCVPQADPCGAAQPKAAPPTPPCLLRKLLPGRRSAGRGGRGHPAGGPAPHSSPYVTDFEFRDPGTRELGRRLCPPGWRSSRWPGPAHSLPGWVSGISLCLWSPGSRSDSSSSSLPSLDSLSFISPFCVAQSLPVPVLWLSLRVVSPSPAPSRRPHLFGEGRDPSRSASWRRGFVQTDPSPCLPGRGRGGLPRRVG